MPQQTAKGLPRRLLPVAVVGWLGVAEAHQSRGWGKLLLVIALRGCWEAGRSLPFIGVVLDCLDESVKAFYERFGFEPLPGHPLRLFLRTKELDAVVGKV